MAEDVEIQPVALLIGQRIDRPVQRVGAVRRFRPAPTVRAVFGMDSRTIPDPTSGWPMMLPTGRHRMAEQ